MIKVGIVGAAGYSGFELIRLLLDHPEVEIRKLFGSTTAGSRIEEIHPALIKLFSLPIESFSYHAIEGLDLLFVALPSGQSFDFVKAAYNKNVKVIDIGGDFRLKNIDDYRKYYNHEHLALEIIDNAVYGLSEWNENNISNAKIISNPGCYPTSVLLALIPLIQNNVINNSFVSIVSYSGTSGAGKSAAQNMIFSEVNENVRAYKVGIHQHIPEIKYYLEYFSNHSINFSFVPHLLPATRGIYTTISARLNDGANKKIIKEIYNSAYSSKIFIRIFEDKIPEMKNVAYTNFCDIGFNVAEDNSLIIFSTIDNLIKGAAGQAIQNMNILFGLPQEMGLLKWNKLANLKSI